VNDRQMGQIEKMISALRTELQAIKSKVGLGLAILVIIGFIELSYLARIAYELDRLGSVLQAIARVATK